MKSKNVNNSLEEFFFQFKEVSLDKNKILIRPDDPLDRIYYISEGYIRQYSVSKEGNEFTFNIFKPKTYFPMVFAFHYQINNYYFETMTPTKLFKAPSQQAINYVKQNSAVMFDLLSRISSGLDGTIQRLESLAFGSAQAKVAATLLLSALRFGKKNKNQVVIDFPLTHQRIASLTGITRETTSIEMKKMKKNGIISYRGKEVIINQLKKLQEISSLSQYNYHLR